MSTRAETSSRLRKRRLGCARVVLAADALGHQAIQGTGHQGELQVEVDLQADHRGERIEVKELDGLGDVVFDQHPLGIARDQGGRTGLVVVGQEHGGLLMAQIDHRQLPQRARIRAAEPCSSSTRGVRKVRVRESRVMRRHAEAGRL